MANVLTHTGIAVERAGPAGQLPLVLIHAGIGDRRMWSAVWPSLTRHRDTVRLDLRGFGESVRRPPGALDPAADVLAALDELGVERRHLVGASFGAGVAVEVALTRPTLVASLMLVAPGGALFEDTDADLMAFVDAEEAALIRGDLDNAVEVNLRWWVDGPYRRAELVGAQLRALVATMQRRAFDIATAWGEVDEVELDPPVLERLDEVNAPTLVLVGHLDLTAVRDAARHVVSRVRGARLLEWSDVAHLPSMERPGRFTALLYQWYQQHQLLTEAHEDRR